MEKSTKKGHRNADVSGSEHKLAPTRTTQFRREVIQIKKWRLQHENSIRNLSMMLFGKPGAVQAVTLEVTIQNIWVVVKVDHIQQVCGKEQVNSC